jgi:hypothetical protein
MHTPVLAVAVLEGCASVVGHGVVVEDEIPRLPLVTVGNPAVIQEPGQLLTERIALRQGPAHNPHEGRLTASGHALALGPRLVKPESVDAGLGVGDDERQLELMAAKCLIGGGEGFPLELAELLEWDAVRAEERDEVARRGEKGQPALGLGRGAVAEHLEEGRHGDPLARLLVLDGLEDAVVVEGHGFAGEHVVHVEVGVLADLENVAKGPHLDLAQLARLAAEDLLLDLHGEAAQKERGGRQGEPAHELHIDVLEPVRTVSFLGADLHPAGEERLKIQFHAKPVEEIRFLAQQPGATLVVRDDLKSVPVHGGGIDNAHAGVCEDRDGAVPGSDEVRVCWRREEVHSDFAHVVGLVDGQADRRLGR